MRIVPISSSTPRTMRGSAAGARRSIWRRRGCVRSRKGCPSSRATPTGISAVIDADGRIVESLPMHAAGAHRCRVAAAHAPTLFARYGNMLPVGFALLLLALAIAFAVADANSTPT